MRQTITAMFENGVLKPTQPLKLPEHSTVSITIELLDHVDQKEERLAALEKSLRLAKPQGEHLTRDQLNERH